MEKQSKITIHQIFWYFILFSIFGLIIETLYCYATMGIIESRKGLIWGPFCPVYGVGATLLILLLNKVNQKNYLKLFLYGFVIGSIVEYLLSYGLEAIFSTRFWNYTYTNMDINGRICVPYSLFWGVLAILLMKVIKPLMDKLISKINKSIRNKVEIALFAFLLIDVFVTIWGLSTYQTRVSNIYLKKEDTNTLLNSQNIFIKMKNKVENEYFTNERMLKIFPKLRMKDENGNELFMKDVLQKTQE